MRVLGRDIDQYVANIWVVFALYATSIFGQYSSIYWCTLNGMKVEPLVTTIRCPPADQNVVLKQQRGELAHQGVYRPGRTDITHLHLMPVFSTNANIRYLRSITSNDPPTVQHLNRFKLLKEVVGSHSITPHTLTQNLSKTSAFCFETQRISI